MRTPRRLKVALGPVEIAGYYTNLAAGFEQIGIESALLMIGEHTFRYTNRGPRGRLARLALERARATHPGKRSSRFARARVRPANLLWRSIVLGQALLTYDAFVFAYGETLLRGADLALLKLLRKRVVFVFHGSDSRPPYLNGKGVRAAGSDCGPALARQARAIKRRLDRVERYADAIVDSPLSGHFHDRPFVNWFRIGIPYAAQVEEPQAATGERSARGRPLRVVHAPSDPETKGSALIERAVERAISRGVSLEFIQLKGRPNAEVLAELARCDFVIDELYSDVPGAGLAFEAASFGRPSIVAGYAADEFQRWILPDMVLPTHYCRPEELDDAIDKLALDADYRTSLGARALRFVREQSAPAVVAERMLRVIEGRDIDGWYVHPHDITYVSGTGLNEETARRAIRAVMEAAGERGLQLPGKYKLVRRLEAFAYGRPLPP